MRAAEQHGSRCRSRQSTGEVTTYNRNVWFPRFCPQGCPLPLEWASPRRRERVAAHARALGQSRALGSPGWHLCVTAAVLPSHRCRPQYRPGALVTHAGPFFQAPGPHPSPTAHRSPTLLPHWGFGGRSPPSCHRTGPTHAPHPTASLTHTLWPPACQ